MRDSSHKYINLVNSETERPRYIFVISVIRQGADLGFLRIYGGKELRPKQMNKIYPPIFCDAFKNVFEYKV